MAVARFRTILVPVDGSAAADAALELALALVDRAGEIVLVHVINRAAIIAECTTVYGGDATPALDAIEGDEREIFERGAERVRSAGVRVSTDGLDGNAVARIVALAAERHAAAIVMGTHGRSGVARIFLGSTAQGVLREATVPVFVVHDEVVTSPARLFKSVVVALDDSPAANAAAHTAIDIAAHDGGRVVLVHVRDGPGAPNVFAEPIAYAETSGVGFDRIELQGSPVDAIIDSARTAHADLIAVGAHGKKARPFGFGSIAGGIARTSPIAVLVVPAPAH